MSFGKPYIMRTEGCIHDGWLVLSPRSANVDAGFFYYLLGSKTVYAEFERRASGATVKNLNIDLVWGVTVPLPPISEQRRIAEILDKADGLRAKRRVALAKLDTIAQSIFLDMFGDPATNPKGWPRLRLVDLCSDADHIKCGPFGTQLARHEYRTEGIPLWGIKHVNALFRLSTREFLERRTASRLSRYSIEPGDIVMTRKGTVGNCAVYPANMAAGVMHSDLLRMRVDQMLCEPKFVAHQLHSSRDVARQLALISGGAIMPGVNVTRLKKLEILFPPIQMQRDFARKTMVVDRIRSAEEASDEKLNAVFASVQHRAFRGEL